MALNFGSFFEKLIGADLRDVANKSSKTMNDFADSFSSVSASVSAGMTNSVKSLQELDKQQKRYEERIERLTKAATLAGKRTAEGIELTRRARVTQEKLSKVHQDRYKEEKKLEKLEKDNLKETKKRTAETTKLSELTFENVAKNNKAAQEEFIKTGKYVSTLTGETLQSFEEIEREDFGARISAGFNSVFKKMDDFGGEMGANMGNLVTDYISGPLQAAFGPLGLIIGKALGETVGKAVKQLVELNKAIIDMTRATGGMIDAAALGTDSMGNIAGTFGSLATAALGANVSMEEFSKAIGSLMSEGMGNVAGAAQDIKKSGGDIRKYGLEAARFAKMYGADISGTVRNMFMDFGKPIGDITDSISNASMKIEAAGLSVKQFVQNLEELTAMSGEIYFKDGIDAMERMAETATRLGTSVSSLTDGLKSMNSLTDLYTQQQKAAAMGMHSFGRNMAKIFALKQAGKGEEAATLRLSSAAQDLSQFMDEKTGTLTQQGIATAQGMGMSEEDIKSINKLSRGAAAAGVSFQQFMGPLEDLTEEQKRAVVAQRKANQTLEERWNIATGLFTQSFIDPIANLFEPVLKSLMSWFEGVMSILSTVGKIVMTVIVNPLKLVAGYISGTFATLGEVFGEVGDKLSNLWKKIEPVFSAIGDALSWIGNLLGKTLAVPLKIIGTVIGWVIDLFSWLIDKIKPVFTFLSDVFDKVGEGLSWLWTKIKDGFNWMMTPIYALGDGLSWIWEKVKGAFEPIIDLFNWLGEVLKPVIEFFGLFEDESDDMLSNTQAVQEMTNAEIAKQMQQTTEPKMQDLNAAKSIEAGVEAAKKDEPKTAGQEMAKGMTEGFKTPITNVKVDASLMGRNDIKTLTTNKS